MLSKYTTVLLPGAVGIALLFDSRARWHFRRPWAYLAAILALLIFMPVVRWNWQHRWVSFRFQLNHGLNGQGPDAIPEPDAGQAENLPQTHAPQTTPASLVAPAAVSAAPRPGDNRKSLPAAAMRSIGQVLVYAGGQVLIWNPLLWLVGGGALIATWKGLRGRAGPRPNPSRGVLFWAAVVPLLFFGLASAKAKGELNWPAFAYFPLTILSVEWVKQRWLGVRYHWIKAGLWVAIVASVVLQFPEWMFALRKPLLALHMRPPAKVDEMFGWRELCNGLEARRAGLPIVCNTQRDAGVFGFYLPGNPDVQISSGGFRATAYDYFDDKPDPRSAPEVMYVGDHADWFCRARGYAPRDPTERPGSVNVNMRSGRVRSRRVYFLVRRDRSPQTPATTHPANVPDH